MVSLLKVTNLRLISDLDLAREEVTVYKSRCPKKFSRDTND